ncbi:MAG: Mrp/NBP35 family ATP-binding protein [Chloroflexi bacterium]|nr:Mrp/NBP35 family ATP-binding protein [Chloroflexota bacterium]
MFLPGVKHILAVASGKGGVGKTTVTVNLALALAQTGAQVGVYDADLYGPNVPLMLGVRRKTSRKGMVPAVRAESQPYIRPLERYGLQVMSVGLVLGDAETVLPDPMFAGHIIRQTLQDTLWGTLDYLLVDFPPGSGEPQQTLVRTIGWSGAVIVTTPQDMALMDTRRSLGLFQAANVPIVGVVENMSYLLCPHCGEQIEVFDRTDRAWDAADSNVDLLGRVPMHLTISQRINARHPLVNGAHETPETAPFREIAHEIVRKYPR